MAKDGVIEPAGECKGIHQGCYRLLGKSQNPMPYSCAVTQMGKHGIVPPAKHFVQSEALLPITEDNLAQGGKATAGKAAEQ